MEANYNNGVHYLHGAQDTLQRVSFTFVNGVGDVLKRVDFAVNPSSMQYNYPDRNVFVQTLGKNPGMQGYGMGLHTIQISGQTGFNQQAIIQEGPTGPHTDYGRAKYLKRILIASIEQAHDDFEGQGIGYDAMSQLHFHNYTDGDSYQVELNPQGVQFSRTNNDPLTYYYSITMTVIRKLTDPQFAEMTPVILGNTHTLFPHHTYINDINLPPQDIDTNALFTHPIRKVSAPQAEANGRGSILNPNPQKDMNTLENKATARLGGLTGNKKAQIMNLVNRATGTPHVIPIIKNGQHVMNVKVNPDNVPENQAFWKKWSSGITPAQNNSEPEGDIVKPTPLSQEPKQQNYATKVTPAFIGVTDGHGIHVLVPSEDFEEHTPQKSALPHNEAYYNRRFFKNTKNDASKPLSNLVNGYLTVSEILLDTMGDMTVKTTAPNSDVPAYTQDYTTITDQGRIFVVQPNQFSPDDLGHTVPASATNISSDYVQFYKNNDELMMIANGKTYTTANNVFIISDVDNQMYVDTEINPNADNWAQISLVNGNIEISPSGPRHDKNSNYYLYGEQGSHTILGKNYLIVPNDNSTATVYDTLTYVEPYAANTDKDEMTEYDLDYKNDVHLTTVNGKSIPITLSDNQVTNKPIIELSKHFSYQKQTPDIIQGQSSRQVIDTPEEDDNQ